MQIGLLNSLTVLPGNSPVDSAKDGDKDTDATQAAAARAAATPPAAGAPANAPAAPASSVILDMQSSAARAQQADLVYTAKPRTTTATPAEAFVHGAVTAMRDYADTQARLKQSATATEVPSLLPRSLGDVQKLAARFTLFR